MKDPLHFPTPADGTRAPGNGAPAEPQNVEAERALLGAILLEPGILAEVAKLLQPADFFIERHTLIYACMTAVAQHGQRVDMVTLCAELEARQRLDFVGGSAYLTAMLDATPTARGFESYAALVHECAQRRRFVHRALDMARIALNEKDVDVRQLVADLQRELDAAQPAVRRHAWTLFTLDEESESDPPLEFVVDPILPTQSLTMLYGAPGTLKSMLLADLAVCVAGGQPWLAAPDGGGGRQTMPVPVLWIDLDNGKRRSKSRFRALLRGHDLPADLAFYCVSMPTPTLDASSEASIDALIALAKELLVGLIVIDNLRLISGPVDENTAAMSGVLANLKRVAEATSAAVVVVHHQRKANGLGGSALDQIRGHSSIPASLDLGLWVEREEGADLVRVSGGKIRDFPVEAFAARWTYTLRANSPELETARFHAVALAQAGGKGSGDAAVREAVVEALAEGGLNKAQVVDKVRETLPDLGVNRIRKIIEAMVGVELSVGKGPKHAQIITLIGT